MEFIHEPVLLQEVLEWMDVKPDGVYCDGTLGGGGHSGAMLRLSGGTATLYGIDRDMTAIEAATARLREFPGFHALHGNFHDGKALLMATGAPKLDGVLLDLGVSSPQLDRGERGFSYHEDAPLDMRMSCSGPTAADLVNTLSEKELADVIYKYGEERKSRQIAAKIVQARQIEPVATTGRLAEIIYAVIRRTPGGIDPATRTFQALRIAVNNELSELENGLKAAVARLKPKGRLAVVTFHSLEDRIVKSFFKENSGPNVHVSKYAKERPEPGDDVIFAETSKAICPSEEEIGVNKRSRSAKLRFGIKR